MKPTEIAELYDRVEDEFGWITLPELLELSGVTVRTAAMVEHTLDKVRLSILTDFGYIFPGFVLAESIDSHAPMNLTDIPDWADHLITRTLGRQDPWRVIEWLMRPHERIDGRRPVDLHGGPRDIKMIRALVEHDFGTAAPDAAQAS